MGLSLTEICGALGVTMQGRLHCGLDDARMVAMAAQALLNRGAFLELIDLKLERAEFEAKAEQMLCLDGLPFDILGSELSCWFSSFGYDVAVGGLSMLLDDRGRPSGRALADFGNHSQASGALSDIAQGKTIKTESSVRLTLLRPLRQPEHRALAGGDGASQPVLVPFPTDARVLARMRGIQATTRKPGDWVCATCHDLVFARNAACRKCGTPKPGGDSVPRSVAAAARARPGDWICPHCNDLVFARNSACRMCRTPRPGAY